MPGLLSGSLPGLNDASFSVALVMMLVGYAAATLLADELRPAPVLAAVVGLIVLFGLAPPILSSDVFGYLGYARLGVLHGADPYRHHLIEAPHDPVLPYTYWRHLPTPYGPLFTLATYPLAWLSVPASVWTLKAAMAAAGAFAVAAVAGAARRMGRSPVKAALLVGANPLLLVYGIGGGHNDLLVMALSAGAIWALAARRPGAGASTLVAATAMKASALVLVPFALVAAHDRRRFVLCGVGAAAATLVVTVIAFGPHLGAIVSALADTERVVEPDSGPDVLGRLLHTDVTPLLRTATAAGALTVSVVLLWRVCRGMHWLTGAAWAALAAICTAPSLEPWYVAWALPLAAAAPDRSVRVATVLATIAIAITRLPVLGFSMT